MLPNLITIGAMKAGTTSLHEYLNAHPDISMSAIKELDYFIVERNWAKGLDWYRTQFEDAPIRGESSQNYTKRHHFEAGVHDRIADCLNDVSFIYLVRDPIDRIVSHYHEAMEGGYAPKEGLNEFLSEGLADNHYVLTSSYFYQLEPYLATFKEERILVVDSDRLKAERLETMNEIFSFLGLSTMSDSEAFQSTLNAGVTKRAKNLYGNLLLGSSLGFLRKCIPRHIKDSMLRSDTIHKALTTPVRHEELDLRLAERIREILAPDIAKLRAWSGKKFERWSF